MKKTSFFLLYAIAALCFSCFNESADNFPNPSAPLPNGVPTEIGTPIGLPVSKEIGPEGGILELENGKIQLTFPSGTLSQTVSVKVQPLSQTLELGIGIPFELDLGGTSLKKPIELTFHYGEEDVFGSGVDFIHLAQQDDNKIWKAKRNLTVNQSAKTIKGTISHPGRWTFFASAKIKPGLKSIGPSQTLDLEIMGYEYELSLRNDPKKQDLLAPLVPPVRIQPALVSQWLIDGRPSGSNPARGSLGFVNNDLTLARYTAPPSVPNQPTVMVSAELFLGKGKFILISSIAIENKNRFSVGNYTFSDPEVLIGLAGNTLTISMWKSINNELQASLAFIIPDYKGIGSYNFSTSTQGGVELISDQISLESIAYDENLKPYFNGSITITESSTQPGGMISGTISGTLYQKKEINNLISYIPYDVEAKFSGTFTP